MDIRNVHFTHAPTDTSDRSKTHELEVKYYQSAPGTNVDLQEVHLLGVS